MRSLVVYDSKYGNTEELAFVIAESLRSHGESLVRHVSGVFYRELPGFDLMVIGSPTQGGRPTEAIQTFIAGLPRSLIRRMMTAAFDTRLEVPDHGFGLQLLIRATGFAAPKIASMLKSKGAKPIAAAEGFVVSDRQGPLIKGERERAEAWAHGLVTVRGRVRLARP